MVPDNQGEGLGLQAQEVPAAEPQRRRWPVWATCLCLLAASALLSAVCFAVFVGPIWGEPGQIRATGGGDPNGAEEALVAVTAAAQTAAPGEFVSATWVVTNTGRSVWLVDRYYFAPQSEGLPVVALPRTVAPGEEVVVQITLPVPPELAAWEPAWQLRGRRGEVPGGLLRLKVRVDRP